MTLTTQAIVRKMTIDDISSWLDMRILLWPHCPLNKHKQEIIEQLNSPQTFQAFIVEVQNEYVGFVEAKLHQHAHMQYGLAGYIEGWFVKDMYRKKGFGKLLVNAIETWTIQKGCHQVASDTEEFNEGSIFAHKKLGYIEQFRADGEVKFLKALSSSMKRETL